MNEIKFLRNIRKSLEITTISFILPSFLIVIPA